jgi:hypothetical protein
MKPRWHVHRRTLSSPSAACIVARKGVGLTERGEGDSFFAVFKRAADAVAAAIAVQRSLDFESWPGKLCQASPDSGTPGL